ncbi:hypothetical protein KX928_21620 [Roseobacter sp. YSTF-M11]|uniref:Uncharacterized protein n=1 Tax=Roseobacter insulae TaxID=2859783 RepID=A0A9X1K498_9RHOB|nr:hypothetical protein [Roseobacter insulae]MBW4710398.1 hypothetical protein [Roseobacter insulae]
MTAGIQALAQSATVTPREFPPVNYTGRQYVDSTGCAFIRAGIDDAVQWVPRVTRDRKLICGLKPTFTVRSATPQAPQEAVVITPKPAQAAVVPAAAKKASSPGPVPLRRAEPNLVGTVVTPANAASKGVTPTMRVMPRHVYRKRKQTLNVSVPKGYRTVWKDDRLNPRRAEQTLQGHADMKQIWTSTTPRRLVD